MRPSLLFVVALSFAFPLPTPGVARSQEDRVYANPTESEEYDEQKDEERRQEKREYDRDREQRWRNAAFTCSGCGRRPEGIQVQAIADSDLIAVLHDIDLEDEFLMVRLRFYNDGSEPASLVIDPAAAYDSIFVVAGGEELHMLRRDDGDVAAKQGLDLEIGPGQMQSWWASFPALPAGTGSFDIVLPPARFEDIPVSAQ